MGNGQNDLTTPNFLFDPGIPNTYWLVLIACSLITLLLIPH